MKYKFKTEKKQTKLNCNSKLGKLFNILKSIGFSPNITIINDKIENDSIRLLNKKYQIDWFNDDANVYFYDSVACYPDKGISPDGWAIMTAEYKDCILINERGSYDKPKDSDFAINTSHYSLHEIMEILVKICEIKKKVNYEVSDSFFLKYTERIKILTIPFKKDLFWKSSYHISKYRGLKKENAQKSVKTKISPYGRKKGTIYDAINSFSVVNKSTQRRSNKIDIYSDFTD
jgi:hypothetical protein